jgi:hypothetical protein
MYARDPAVTPDAVTEPWSLPLMVPCSSIRVTKSKKKHTKVIEEVGTGNCEMEATDSAETPYAVKAVWYVLNGFEPSPYPNVIVPSIQAAEQEVPRLVQLKMCELMVAQHRRCLGCGHEYVARVEVVFRIACMHHHCVCCGEELGNDVCIVCAEE